MKYGSSIDPEADLKEDIRRMPDDLDFLEIAIGEFDREIEGIDGEELREVLEEEGYGLIVHLPFGQPFVTRIEEFNQAELDYLERIVEFSETAGAEKAVLHPDIRYREEGENVEEEFIDQLERLDEICRKNGIELCVENMPPQINCAANDFELAQLLEELDISMCFDSGHGYASMGQEEMEELLEKHSDIVSHLHLQDSREGEDLHMPVGSAEIDFEGIAEKLPEFNQSITLEVFTADNEYLNISLERTRKLF
jgi:sugar phosphate isomerase/epimerase